jgi:hypothetical protein
LKIDITLVPQPRRYFPAVELGGEAFLSGYVVPALSATASGKICVAGRCRSFAGAPSYHDHNWGVWAGVTWEWGTGTGSHYNLLYGGVYGLADTVPLFLALVDSLGVKQVLRFRSIDYEGARPVAGQAKASAPSNFSLVATQASDTIRLKVTTQDALGSRITAGGFQRVFLQMRGRFELSGRVQGEAVADSGMGFFETYVGKPGGQASR